MKMLCFGLNLIMDLSLIPKAPNERRGWALAQLNSPVELGVPTTSQPWRHFHMFAKRVSKSLGLSARPTVCIHLVEKCWGDHFWEIFMSGFY